MIVPALYIKKTNKTLMRIDKKGTFAKHKK